MAAAGGLEAPMPLLTELDTVFEGGPGYKHAAPIGAVRGEASGLVGSVLVKAKGALQFAGHPTLYEVRREQRISTGS